MTRAKMEDVLAEYCSTQDSCTKCLLREFDGECEFRQMKDKVLEEMVKVLSGVLEDAFRDDEEDVVNHPKHYERAGAMGCIDEMRMIFGALPVYHFCICNAWKYRYRAANKNGAEDIAKSDWYMAKAKKLKEEIELDDLCGRFEDC